MYFFFTLLFWNFITVFQELPDGSSWELETGRTWMQDLAKKTEKANEKLEGVKTTLKVRGVL